MQSVTKTFRWEMGHRLMLHEGKCRHMHGHSYRADVTLSGVVDPNTGMVVDFYEMGFIKERINRVLDHAFALCSSDEMGRAALACVPGTRVFLMDGEPTAENIAGMIARWAQDGLESRASVSRVRVWETETCYATWSAV